MVFHKVKNNILIVLLFIVSCDSQDHLIQDIIAHAQVETVLDINDITDFKWERAYIIYPFASSEKIERLTGISDVKRLDLQRGIYFVYEGDIVYQIIETYHPERYFQLEIDTNNGFLMFTPETSKFRVLRNEPYVSIERLDLSREENNNSGP